MDPFDSLRGNEQLKTFFKRQIEKESLAHAYVLEGEDGTGRHTLALAVARALAGDTPEGAKIARGLSPDVKCYGPPADKKLFNVDLIRDLRADAYLVPNDLPFKFYILEKSETMNASAQNAALKILEEPPANTYFFLLCSSSSALLPTIRSRAPVLRMQRFSVEELDALLSREGAQIKQNDRDFYYACLKGSGGSYGAAKEALLQPKNAESRKTVCALLACFEKQAELIVRSAELPKKRQEAEEVLTLMQRALRDILVSRMGAPDAQLLFFSDDEEARKYLPGAAKEQITALIDLTDELQDALSRNANMQNLRFALCTGVRAALTK